MKETAKKSLGKPKKRSWKFWAAFWLVSAILLFGWYLFLQIQNRNIGNLKPFAKVLPVGSERQNELKVLADVYEKMGGFEREKTFLILFQNDMELRPGGGFIGSFGIVKAKNGKISDIQIHDTGNFDGRIPNTETPPAPMAEMLGIKSWKLRDSNWSPDFQVNAEKAEYFYKLGEGGENFDGVIAVNTDILNSVLAITGPVKIDGFPGEYNDQTAILQLEYQVERGFLDQGIERGERKNIMKDFAAVLVEKAHGFTLSQQLEFSKKIEEHLKKKDIQFSFNDESLQEEIDSMGWGGRVKEFSGDYLMVVDANLNSLKSDICIKRKISYDLDLSGEVPQAVLELTYEHTCRAKDWMTKDYQSFTRVFTPAGAWYEGQEAQTGEVKFENDLGKKVFGRKILVPIGETRTVTFRYNLPKEVQKNGYSLLLQKQSGVSELPVRISVKKADGSVETVEEILKEDKVFNF